MTETDAFLALAYATAAYLAYCVLTGSLLMLLGRVRATQVNAAPDAFDLVWTDIGRRSTREGEHHLWQAVPTEAFSAAWKASKEALKAAGYAFVKTPADSWAVAFWERPSAPQVDLGGLRDIEAAARAAAAAKQAEREAQAAASAPVIERLRSVLADHPGTLSEWGRQTGADLAARDVLSDRQRNLAQSLIREAEASIRLEAAAVREGTEAQSALREILTERPWTLTGSAHDEARSLVERSTLTPAERKLAIGLVKRAKGIVDQARGRVDQAELDAALVERMADPKLRTQVHAGCRRLSLLDLDRASVENEVGWSKSTSFTGHYLAQLSELSPREAVVGFGLLRKHQRQIDDALRQILFG